MGPAIYSGIVTWDAPVSNWPIFFPVPGYSPRRLCEISRFSSGYCLFVTYQMKSNVSPRQATRKLLIFFFFLSFFIFSPFFCFCFPFCLEIYSRKYWIKLVPTCFATLLQSELNSEVALLPPTSNLSCNLVRTREPWVRGCLATNPLVAGYKKLMQKVQSSPTFCSKICTCLLAFLQQVT